MCDTCGCGQEGEAVKISRPGETNHHLDHHHDHDHNHGRQHKLIRLEEDILGKNNLVASHNSGFFEAKGIIALNLMSSPGSGKTTLLEKTSCLSAGAKSGRVSKDSSMNR